MRNGGEREQVQQTKLAILDVPPTDWRCCCVEHNRNLWKAHLAFFLTGLPLVGTSLIFKLPVLLFPGAILLLTSLVVWSVLCCCPQEDHDGEDLESRFVLPKGKMRNGSAAVLNEIGGDSLNHQNSNIEVSTPHVSSTQTGSTYAIGHPVSDAPSLDPQIMNSSSEERRRRFASMGALPNILYHENRRGRTLSIV
ncbi:hypothetical protein BSKO_12246 [Bryopsis sp. KO-2023]|nr:hypothetical protein BSKO_12246 [Bryopsis sp. KO-2023]